MIFCHLYIAAFRSFKISSFQRMRALSDSIHAILRRAKLALSLHSSRHALPRAVGGVVTTTASKASSPFCEGRKNTMPSSALVTQLFSSLMRVYRSFPPVAPGRRSGCRTHVPAASFNSKFSEPRRPAHLPREKPGGRHHHLSAWSSGLSLSSTAAAWILENGTKVCLAEAGRTHDCPSIPRR